MTMKKRPPTFVIIFSIIWAIIFFPVSMTIPNIAGTIVMFIIGILPIAIYIIIRAVKRSDEKRARGLMYGNQEINKRLQEADLQLSEARKTASIIIQRAKEDANKILETANQDAQTIEKRKQLLETEANDLSTEIDELKKRVDSANSDLIISETTVYFFILFSS